MLYRLMTIISLLIVSTVFSTNHAQGDVSLLTAVQTAVGIEIHSVDMLGKTTPITVFTDFGLQGNTTQAQWSIEDRDILTSTQDGSRIAFTASRGSEFALFIYTLATNDLEQIALPDVFKPIWSPDNTSILLLPAPWTQPIYQDYAYVYHLEESVLIEIANTDNHRTEFNWLPDGSGLIYEGVNISCLNCSYFVVDLYSMNRFGDDIKVLTDLYTQVPTESPLTICNPTWSQADQRVYYVVGCSGGEDDLPEYIYSVDLEGNNRQELRVDILFLSEFNVKTVGIHPNINLGSINLTIYSQGVNGTSEASRRIMQLKAPNATELFLDQPPDGRYLSISSALLNSSKIALSLGSYNDVGYIDIFDLDSAQVINEISFNQWNICDVRWLDKDNLLYIADDLADGNDCRYNDVQYIYEIYNLPTDTTTPVFADTDEFSWVLRPAPVYSMVIRPR